VIDMSEEVIESITLDFKQVWEDYFPKIIFNNKLEEWDDYNCSHVKIVKGERIVPIVLVCINEGDCNSTGICLDCLFEAKERILELIKERMKE